MATYVTKQLIVDAVQWNGSNEEEICQITKATNYLHIIGLEGNRLLQLTINGRVINIRHNDWLVNVDGKLSLFDTRTMDLLFERSKNDKPH